MTISNIRTKLERALSASPSQALKSIYLLVKVGQTITRVQTSGDVVLLEDNSKLFVKLWETLKTPAVHELVQKAIDAALQSQRHQVSCCYAVKELL